MKNFTDEIIEDIKLNNDILDVVSEYVKLTRKGKDYFGLCPFHGEKTASFSVAPPKGIYYCFGCHAGGNVVQFVMNIENLSYGEAVTFLAKRANISLPEDTDPKAAEKARKKELVISINKKAAHFYHENLKNSKIALSYLVQRKIREAAIVHFGIGYADESYESLYNHLLSSGFKSEDIADAGLVSKGRNGGYYDKFRNRIIFPIFDVYGNVIAFGGRVIDDSQPKYLNSPETVVYKKGKHLYGLNFAKKTSRNYIVLVEGYVDVVVLFQEGYDCFAASLGTALTTDQARLANRYGKKIILAYDNDDAGTEATLKALSTFASIGTEASVVSVPEGKDPDGYIKLYGAKKFGQLIENPMTPVEYRIKILMGRHQKDNTGEKVHLIKAVVGVLSEIDDISLIDYYAARYSAELGVSKEAVMNEISRGRGNKSPAFNEIKQQDIKIPVINDKSRYEILILLFYLNHLTGRDKIAGYFDSAGYDHGFISDLCKLALSDKKDPTLADVLEIADSTDIPDIIKLNEIAENIEDKGKALDDFMYRLQGMKLEDERQSFREKGKDGALDSETIKSLKEYSERIKRLKKAGER